MTSRRSPSALARRAAAVCSAAPPSGAAKSRTKVHMEVDIGGGRNGRIALYDGADPRVLAAQFVREHRLAPAISEKLAGLIQRTMQENGIAG